jgi:hypothetical protein
LLDTSGSIRDKGPNNWDLIINFVNSIINSFDIGPSATRVGVVTFSNSAQLRIKLNQIYDKQELMQMMKTPNFYGAGKTNLAVSHVVVNYDQLHCHCLTQAGLEVSRTELFNTINGDRTSIQDVLIMITDGISSHADPSIPPEERSQFKVSYTLSETCL